MHAPSTSPRARRAGAVLALIAGTALGVIYVGAGRRVAVSLPARLTFELGVLVLVWQRLV